MRWEKYGAVVDAMNGLFMASMCILGVFFFLKVKLPVFILAVCMVMTGVLLFFFFSMRRVCVCSESRFVQAGKALFVQEGHCVHNGFGLDGKLVLCENEVLFFGSNGICYFEYGYRDYDITADLEGTVLNVVFTGLHDLKYGSESCFSFTCSPVELAVIYKLLVRMGANFCDEFLI